MFNWSMIKGNFHNEIKIWENICHCDCDIFVLSNYNFLFRFFSLQTLSEIIEGQAGHSDWHNG